MKAGRILRPIASLALTALVACGDDVKETADSTDATDTTAVDTDVSDGTSADTSTLPDADDVASDVLADSAPGDADTTPDDAVSDATNEVSEDGSPADTSDVRPFDPETEAAFIPGPYSALRADQPIDLVDLIRLNPTAPAAEDALAFVAVARTSAGEITASTPQGDKSIDLGSPGVAKDVLLGFDTSGTLVSSKPASDTGRSLSPRFGQCWVSAGTSTSMSRVTGNDGNQIDVVDDALASKRYTFTLPGSTTPLSVDGTFTTDDGHPFAVLTSDRGFAVKYPNGVTLAYPGTGLTSSAVVSLAADRVPATSNVDARDFIKVMNNTHILDVLGGTADAFYFTAEVGEIRGSAGAAGTPRSVGIHKRDLTARLDAVVDPPIWKCQDECLTQISPSFWCGKTSHFRTTGPSTPPVIVITGTVTADITFPGGINFTWDGTNYDYLIVLDENGNPRIGRKGGGMSIDKVGFTPTGDVIVGGIFAGAAGLGIEAQAIGVADAFFGVFDAMTLTPKRSFVSGAAGEKTTLASDWLEIEKAGTCTATGELGGFALRRGDELFLAALGDNGRGCVGDPMPAGNGKTLVVDGADGNLFFALPPGSAIPFTTADDNGLPISRLWPPVDTWQQALGYSRARVHRNSR